MLINNLISIEQFINNDESKPFGHIKFDIFDIYYNIPHEGWLLWRRPRDPTLRLNLVYQVGFTIQDLDNCYKKINPSWRL